jgi:hypothetical protein
MFAPVVVARRTSRSPGGQRAWTGAAGRCCEARVDYAFISGATADRVGEGTGRGVLDDEAGDAAVDGSLEMAGSPVRGDDEAPGNRRELTELAGNAQPIAVGHLDVEHEDVWPVLRDGFDDIASGRGFADDVDVGVLAE